MPVIYFDCNYAHVEDPVSDFEYARPSLCVTDGTADGTRPIMAGWVRAIERIGPRVVVVIGGDGPVRTVHAFDREGTGGTTILDRPGTYKVVGKAGGSVFLSDSATTARTGIYATDGTVAGTRFYPTTIGGRAIVPLNVQIHGQDLVFSARVKTAAGDRWAFYAVNRAGRLRHLLTARPAETTAGAQPVTDPSFAILGDRLILRDFSATSGQEPWSFDLKSKTRTLLKDIAPGPASSGIVSSPNYGDGGRFATFDRRVYFAAAGPDGVETWSTDGTPAGTVVHPIRPGAAGSAPHLGEILRVGAHAMIWPAMDVDAAGGEDPGPAARRLGYTAGSTGSTRSIRIYDGKWPLVGESHLTPFRMRNATWIFNTSWSDDVTEGLYRINLSNGQARLVAPMENPVPLAGYAFLAGKIYFSAADVCESFRGVHACNNELWVSDGTAAGTHMVAELDNTLDEIFFLVNGSYPAMFVSTE